MKGWTLRTAGFSTVMEWEMYQKGPIGVVVETPIDHGDRGETTKRYFLWGDGYVFPGYPTEYAALSAPRRGAGNDKNIAS